MDFLRTKRARSTPDETGRTALSFASVTALTESISSGQQRPLLDRGTMLHGGRFEICEVLGSGGEAVVYRAMDRELAHDIALKILHLSDASSIPALKREFRFLRDLIHPSLVQLHELVVDRQLSFYTMSLISGKDFLLAATDEAALRDLLSQLAEVLDFLHSEGRVHRDIKATNILVRPEGTLTLLDFGVGLDLLRPGRSHSGPLGTPRYMAPELLKGEPATPKCDAYSVGVLLYEALTGEHPNESGRTEPGRTTTASPAERRPQIPLDLDRLCARLLEPDPLLRAGIEAIASVAKGREDSSGIRRRQSQPADGWFTGRAIELARLDETFERVVEGCQPIVAFVEAKSGLGKTAFLNRFLESRKEAVIFRSKCSEHELVPHKAIDGIVDDLVDYLLERSTEDILELIPPSEAGILVQLFPEFQRIPALETVTPMGSPLGDFRAMRLRAYLALAGVLGRLSDEVSLIVAIDDLQWGDVDSGKLLREVFAGSDRPNCLLLLAYRSEERHRSPCLHEVLDGQYSLVAELVNTTIALQPLLRRDAQALVASITRDFSVSQAVLERIIAEADGSPLLLTELVSHLRNSPDGLASGFGGMDEIVQHRVGRLPPALRESFRLLCCSGSPLSLGLMSSLCKHESEDILFGLSHARLARMRRGGQEIEVFHDSMRESMLRQLGSARARLHETLAEALVARKGDEAEIARHFEACGDHEAASGWAEAAADRASRSLALTQAVDLFRLALREERKDDMRKAILREKLACALADAGRGSEAAPIFASLAESAPAALAVGLRRQAAEHWLTCGESSRGVKMLAQVQQEVGLSWPHSNNDALRRFLWERLRLRLNLRSTPRVGKVASQQVSEQLEACRSGWMVSFVSTIHATANSARYLRLAIKSGDAKHLAIGYGLEAIYRSLAGESQRNVVEHFQKQARGMMSDPLDGYERAFAGYVSAQCNFMLGNAQACPGPFEVAERAFLENCRNVSWELNSSRIFWSQSLSLLGRLNEWGRRLSLWVSDAEDRGDVCLLSAMKIGQGRRSVLVDGDPQLARELVREGSRRWSAPAGGLHHFMEQFASAYIDACSGNPTGVLTTTGRIRADMHTAHMDRVQVPRVNLAMAEGFACVEKAVDSQAAGDKRALLAQARKNAQALHQEQATWAETFAEQIEASCDLVERPTNQAINRLRRVAKAFDRLDYRLHHAAVTARVGELLGGDEGRDMVAQGHGEFADVGAYDWVTALSGYMPRLLPR